MQDAARNDQLFFKQGSHFYHDQSMPATGKGRVSFKEDAVPPNDAPASLKPKEDLISFICNLYHHHDPTLLPEDPCVLSLSSAFPLYHQVYS